MQLAVQRPGRENLGRIHKNYRNEAIINKKCLDNIKKRNQELNKIRMQIFDSREYKRLVFQQLRNDTLQQEKAQEQQYQNIEKQYNNYKRTNEIKYPQNKEETARLLRESRDLNEYIDNGVQGDYSQYEARQQEVLQQQAKMENEQAQQLKRSYWTMSSPIPNIHAQKLDASINNSPSKQKKILKTQSPKQKPTPKKQVQIQLTNSQEQKNSPELKNGSHTASLFSKESYKDETESLQFKSVSESHKDDELRLEDFLESPDQDTNTAIKTMLREHQSMPMQSKKSLNEIFQLDEDHLFSDDVHTIQKANEFNNQHSDVNNNNRNNEALMVLPPAPHSPVAQQMRQNIQDYISEQGKTSDNNKLEMSPEEYEMQQVRRMVQDTIKSFDEQQRLSGNQFTKSGVISNQPPSNNFVNTVEFIPKQDYPSFITQQLPDKQSVEYIAARHDILPVEEAQEYDGDEEDVSIYDSRQFPTEIDATKQSILDEILAEHQRVKQTHEEQAKNRHESDLLKYSILKNFNVKQQKNIQKSNKSGFIPQKQYTNHFVTKPKPESAPIKTVKKSVLYTKEREAGSRDKVLQLQNLYLQQQQVI